MTTSTPAGSYGRASLSTAFLQAYVDAQVAGVLDTAPETLDTLNELAAAINDDPAFFSSMATANAALQTNIDTLTTNASDARAALQTLLQNAVDAVQADVDTQVAGLVDSAPGVLNTLDELAAALGDDENFATTITNSIAAVQTDVDANEVTAAGLVTAQNTAMLSAVAAVQADVDQNESDADTAIATKFDKSGGVLTGSLVVAKSFPDLQLKANDEKRLLFSDAGGGSTAAIKHVSTSLDFYAGGIASGNKEFSVDPTGVTVAASVTLAGGLTDAANDSDAATAGVAVGQLYRNGSVVMIRVS